MSKIVEKLNGLEKRIEKDETAKLKDEIDFFINNHLGNHKFYKYVIARFPEFKTIITEDIIKDLLPDIIDKRTNAIINNLLHK